MCWCVVLSCHGLFSALLCFDLNYVLLFRMRLRFRLLRLLFAADVCVGLMCVVLLTFDLILI